MRAHLLLCTALIALSGCNRPAQEAHSSQQPAQQRLSREPVAQASPALPQHDLSIAARAAWREVLQWPAECEESFQPATEDYGGLTFYPLATGESLVEVVCMVGAYQLSQVYLHYRETPPPAAHLLSFPLYFPDEQGEWQREEATELTGLPEFDPDSHELTLLTKYRGVGDCGSLARYRFEDGTPHLVEFRGKAACDGSAEEWPRIGPLAPPSK